jgi:hypothetical protein
MKQVKCLLGVLMVLCVCASSFAQDAKRAYAGVRLGVGAGLTRPLGELEAALDYPGSEWSKGGASFDVAPFVSLQIADAFAIQTEMLITKYGGEYSYKDPYDSDEDEKFGLSRSALIIPLLVKFTFHPNIFTIQAFLGPHLTANVGKWATTYAYGGIEGKEDLDDKELAEEYFGADKLNYPPIGITGGLGFGVKAGPGNVLIDARFITDAGVIYADAPTYGRSTKKENFLYRAKLSFTVGYEFGFGKR